jgi:hypothetical protein
MVREYTSTLLSPYDLGMTFEKSANRSIEFFTALLYLFKDTTQLYRQCMFSVVVLTTYTIAQRYWLLG